MLLVGVIRVMPVLLVRCSVLLQIVVHGMSLLLTWSQFVLCLILLLQMRAQVQGHAKCLSIGWSLCQFFSSSFIQFYGDTLHLSASCVKGTQGLFSPFLYNWSVALLVLVWFVFASINQGSGQSILVPSSFVMMVVACTCIWYWADPPNNWVWKIGWVCLNLKRLTVQMSLFFC